MKILVTGGTGFLGSHLLKHLLETTQAQLNVLTRGGLPALEEALGPAGAAAGAYDQSRVEVFEGGLQDAGALAEAVEGCSHVAHLAGRVSRSPTAHSEMMQIHVEGTRRVLEAAAEAKVQKLVVVTTSGTVGVSKNPSFVAKDDSPYPLDLVQKWPYYLSKVYQEQLVRDLSARHGLDAVILRPSLLLGPGDLRASSTGDVRQFLERKLPVVPSGGISFLDVRDAAIATASALERGVAGQSYLLTAANWTLKHFFDRLAMLAGMKAPYLKLPSALTGFGAQALRLVQQNLGVDTGLSPVSLEMAECFWAVDSAKAARDLGFQPRPPERTLRDTIAWLRRG